MHPATTLTDICILSCIELVHFTRDEKMLKSCFARKHSYQDFTRPSW
jgi:hypothetical protein